MKTLQVARLGVAGHQIVETKPSAFPHGPASTFEEVANTNYNWFDLTRN